MSIAPMHVDSTHAIFHSEQKLQIWFPRELDPTFHILGFSINHFLNSTFWTISKLGTKLCTWPHLLRLLFEPSQGPPRISVLPPLVELKMITDIKNSKKISFISVFLRRKFGNSGISVFVFLSHFQFILESFLSLCFGTRYDCSESFGSFIE